MVMETDFSEYNPYPVMRADVTGTMLYANEASQDLVQALQLKVNQTLPENWCDAIMDSLHAEHVHETEVTVLEKTYRLVFIPVMSDGYVNIYAADVSETKKLAEQAWHSEHHDILTGLPGRLLIEQKIEKCLQKVNKKSPIGLLLIGIVNLSNISTLYGFSTSDELILRLVKRLQVLLGDQAQLARISTHQVLLLWDSQCSVEILQGMASRIKDSLTEPFLIAKYTIRIAINMGIAISSDELLTAEGFMKQADLAMLYGKVQGYYQCQVYQAGIEKQIVAQQEMLNHLITYVEKEQLRLVYQPQWDIQGDLLGAEALLRFPGDYTTSTERQALIASAEETGLIIEIGKWVLREACSQIAMWSKQYKKAYRYAINISPKQFYQADFLSQVKAILADTECDPQNLCFEITENIMITYSVDVLESMRELVNMGITLSIDDFGTGYSSMRYLKSMPLAQLKIDHSFVNDLGMTDETGTVVNAMIQLAHNLGMKVLAEGVETQSQLAWLQAHACDQIQGYLWGKPVDSSLMTELLQRNN